MKETIPPKASFRDTLATLDESGKRKWVYAQQPKGKWYKRRTWLSLIYFLFFFSAPFISINGNPLFQFNIPEGKYILFAKVFWPQDFFIFGLGMIAFILSIVLFTAAFGRLFCGWACPQTILMEMLFRRIEYWIEGDAASQKMLNRSPWNTEKWAKKTVKHISFFLLSFLIANIFLAYIIGAQALQQLVVENPADHIGGLLTLLAFTGIFYAVYAFFREQVCTAICPYGRLQGVLMDKNSMIVAYDYKRGEPRGKFNRRADAPRQGDCIDCFQCVKVCPTGIDIRNGVQMECVGCTACMDACDRMMEKVGKPLGLIRYASEQAIETGAALRFTVRMKFFSFLLVLIMGVMAAMLYTRKDVVVTVLRAPGMLFQERGIDSISNLYNIKLSNKSSHELELTFRLEDIAGKVQMVGKEMIAVPPQGQAAATFFLVLPRSYITGRKTNLKLGIYQGEKRLEQEKTTFLGPLEP